MTKSAALTPEQIEELRQELERERARLERSMPSTREAAKPVALDQTAVGRLSRMDALANQHLTQDLAAREESRHTGIMLALERIAKGAYGQCERCGGPIPYGRLLVLPEARTCATCGGR